MKAKELKIEAPEGYEVDWDNSSNNVIRFKPIKKQITYEDVIINIRATNIGVSVQFGLTKIGEDCFVTSEEQLEQLLALNKIMNVANYLNGNWEADWDNSSETKWCLFFDHSKKQIVASNWQSSHYGCVYFKSEELTYQAIEILGEEEVKKALGIFE
jgi:hypothetical protein